MSNAQAVTVEAMRTVPIGAVHPNPWNPNHMEEREFEAQVESITTYGFIDPITVRPHPDRDGEYQIIDGEHRHRAALRLGHDQVPVIVLPLTDAQAKKLTAIFIETKGKADTVQLGQLLRELAMDMDVDALRIGLPFTPVEVQDLISAADFDWDAIQPALPPSEDEAEEREWETLHFRVPSSVARVVDDALAKALADNGMHDRDPRDAKDRAVALEIIAASYNAGP